MQLHTMTIENTMTKTMTIEKTMTKTMTSMSAIKFAQNRALSLLGCISVPLLVNAAPY